MASIRIALAALAAGALVGALPAAPAAALDTPVELVSVSHDGYAGDDGTSSAAVSADGRYVVLLSSATDLLPYYYNGFVFLRDRVVGTTTPVAVSSGGTLADDGAFHAAVSDTGRYVVFSSHARNLVPGDTNGVSDVFVRDTVGRTTTRVSLSTTGAAANQSSDAVAVSGDGRFVAFVSTATNLAPRDTNGTADLFVHDRQDGSIRRASVSTAGVQADAAVDHPAISGNGRYVSFWSTAANLVPGDTNGVADAFVRDLRTGVTSRVSVAGGGGQATGASTAGAAALSRDGRYVTFASAAANLVAGDTNGVPDVFRHDRSTGTTTLVSRPAAGGRANGASSGPSISADGRYLAFASDASNLVAGDTNGAADIFVRDLATGQLSRPNVAASGAQADEWSYAPHLSADGRVVVFTSGAANLVPGDYNNNFDIFARQLAG